MINIIIAIIGSGALSAIIAGIFNLINNRRERLDKRFEKFEKDILRTQMLMMLKLFPEEKQEILKLAEHYFGDLNGNWYLTTMFNHWLEAHKIARPEWFKEDIK